MEDKVMAMLLDLSEGKSLSTQLEVINIIFNHLAEKEYTDLNKIKVGDAVQIFDANHNPIDVEIVTKVHNGFVSTKSYSHTSYRVKVLTVKDLVDIINHNKISKQ